jgi:hypothetical protein
MKIYGGTFCCPAVFEPRNSTASEPERWTPSRQILSISFPTSYTTNQLFTCHKARRAVPNHEFHVPENTSSRMLNSTRKIPHGTEGERVLHPFSSSAHRMPTLSIRGIPVVTAADLDFGRVRTSHNVTRLYLERFRCVSGNGGHHIHRRRGSWYLRVG